MSKFENTVKSTLKNSLFIMISNLPTSLLIALLDVFAGVICYLFWPALLVMPGVAMWIVSVKVEKVFNKYIPDESEESTGEEADTSESEE